MNQTPFYDQDFNQTTSTRSRGGCFSLLIIPLVTILIISSWLRFLNGGSNPEFALRITINEIPASAHSMPAPSQAPTPAPQPEIAPFFAPSVQFWKEEIIQWADQNDLDPNLIATVIQIESCGDPRALSPAGAIGLFQVMPYHFEETEAPYNPEINAARGLAYLNQSLVTHQTVRLALAGYNGGIGTAAKPESEWPKETIRYAYWGNGIFNEAINGQLVSQRLEEWYQAGGNSLCQQAEERLSLSP